MIAVLVSASWLLAVQVQTPAPQATQAQDSVRIERLAALGRLWYAARLFHPYLAYRDIDWDSTLVAAIPRVSAARLVRFPERLPQPLHGDLIQGTRYSVVLSDQAEPVRVHTSVQRLVVKQLCCPLDSVDLRNLGGDNEARDLEYLLGCGVPVANDFSWLSRIAKTRVPIGVGGRSFPELVDEEVMLAGKDIVVES